MYLRIGGYTRPFLEANVDPSFQNFFDGQRRLYKTGVTYQIDGKIVLQTGASEAAMTREINALKVALGQINPDVILLNSDGVTPSHFALYANKCVVGPQIMNWAFPSNAGRLYHTSCPYSITVYAEQPVGNGSPILAFNETVDDQGTGGWEKVFVGGAINPPEEQIGQQYSTYRYTQSGSAMGLYGWPQVPPPLWPFALKRQRPKIQRSSPELMGDVAQNYRISWAYEYESPFELFGDPHTM